jgi:hypothetical protein
MYIHHIKNKLWEIVKYTLKNIYRGFGMGDAHGDDGLLAPLRNGAPLLVCEPGGCLRSCGVGRGGDMMVDAMVG